MKIVIITMDDPVYTIPFFKDIIDKRKSDIVGVAVATGDRMKIGKNKSKIIYLLSLLIIMGPQFFSKNFIITSVFKIKKRISKTFSFIKSPSLISYAKDKLINTYEINSPNSKDFLFELKRLEPDIIINQSQHILKSDLLQIPKLGTLNRHNALLPKNRGRLTPFWVLFRNEKETGVSIHFVNEGIDTGDIIVQKRFDILPNDTFKTIVEKNYKIASNAMLEALDLIESGKYELIKNDSEAATYNSTPTFKDAIRYRVKRLIK